MKNAMHRLNWHDGVELLDMSFEGHPFGKHSHDAYAIGVIEDGVGGNFHRGEKKILPPRSLSLMNPDELHDGFSVSGSLQYKVLYISEKSMRELVGNTVIHGFRHDAARDVDGVVAAALRSVQTRLTARNHAGWRLAIDSDLTFMIETVMSRNSRNTLSKAGAEPRSVGIVKEYLDSRILSTSDNPVSDHGDSVSLKTLAELVELKPNYLLTAFTHHVGVPPYTYWMARRIGIAKKLLAQGERISRVAYQLGFYDQAHFSRSFKRSTGVTPGRFFGY